MYRKVYITAATQISVQKPLCEDWMSEPLTYSEPFMRCLDPDYKPFFNPMQARRMGLLFKRAMATSRTVMAESGIGTPDAVVTGTSLGCIENTELFLDEMTENAEQSLSPTPFMQSTHNTTGSLIAIQTGCHGYNCTYSHNEVSFESALLDAFMQLRSGVIDSALAGNHDEMTPAVADVLARSGYAGGNLLSEGSVAMMLTCATSSKPLAEVLDVRIFHRPDDFDAIVGSFGAEYVMGSKDVFSVFGKSFSSPALGVYAAARMIAAGRYSNILVVNDAGVDKGLVHLCGSC